MSPETANTELITAIICLISVGLPAVIAILRLTRWGRANAAKLDAAQVALNQTELALGHVVGAIGTLRRTKQSATAIKQIMTAKEEAVAPGVVQRWKKQVAKWDPKTGTSKHGK